MRNLFIFLLVPFISALFTGCKCDCEGPLTLSGENADKMLRQYTDEYLYYQGPGQKDSLRIEREETKLIANEGSYFGCDGCRPEGSTKLVDPDTEITHYTARLDGDEHAQHVDIFAFGSKHYFLPSVMVNGQEYKNVDMNRVAPEDYPDVITDSSEVIIERYYKPELGLLKYKNLKGEFYDLLIP